MIYRGFRYRLDPTETQEVKFRQFAGVVRLVYNLALEQRRDHWRAFHRAHGRNISFFSQSAEIKGLRASFDWVGDVYTTCLGYALRDLDGAFQAFFRGTAAFPRFKKAGVRESFRFKGAEIETRRLNAKWSAVRIPKIGWVRFRETRPILGKIKNATVSLDALGWYISFACEIEHDAPANAKPAVGIDRGVANTIMLSTGEAMSVPSSLEAIERRHRAAQRVIARRKKGSKRRLRAVRKAAKLAARRARIRRDFHHKAALSIAQRFGLVVIEDLKIKNMTASGKRKRGLNRSILNQGWYSFEAILRYKLEERGGELASVNPAFTSLTCSECGAVDKKSRESQATFLCRHCGFRDHADRNAALNILRRSTPYMRAEEAGYGPVEARTDNLASARGC